MYTPPIKLSRPQVSKIRKLIPFKYTGWKVSVRVAESVTLSDLNWSGGTRSQYFFVTPEGLSVKSDNQTAPWDNRQEGVTVPLRKGVICIEESYFCGHLSVQIHVHPDDMPKLLPPVTAGVDKLLEA